MTGQISRNVKAQLNKIWWLAVALGLALNGCRSLPAMQAITSVTSSQAITPSPIFTRTPTIALPTKTKLPRSTPKFLEDEGLPERKLSPTPTKIPSATLIPTITPTFDPSHIITRTPSPAAVCPDYDEKYLFDGKIVQDAFKNDEPVLDDFLAFLNNGGNPSSLVYWYEDDPERRNPDYWKDLTGDGVPELVASSYYFETYIFGCREGKYELLWTEKADDIHTPSIAAVADMNLDGVNEVVFYAHTCNWGCLWATIYEWDGSGFQPLILWYTDKGKSITNAWTEGVSNIGGQQIYVKDTDGNGTLELVLVGGIAAGLELKFTAGPWRETTTIYMWNGSNFVLRRILYDAPQYRFQAVQDGDRAALEGDYDRAFAFYWQAIEDKGLDWWSLERLDYDIAVYRSEGSPNSTSLPPVPEPDPAEYPILAAYAYYRILLLYVLLGKLPEAEAVYDTLKAKFPLVQPGSYFTILASTFLEEYKASQLVYLACQQVIQYTERYPDILAYLGEPNHGMESIVYTPEDVCPFH